MKAIFIYLILLFPLIGHAQGISEAAPFTPHEASGEKGNPIYDRPSPYDSSNAKNLETNTGVNLKEANRQGKAIDVELRNTAFDLARKSGKLREKASYYQKLGWALIGAGGSGAYFFWKARQFRKDARSTKQVAKNLFDKADQINDVDDDEFNALLPEDSNYIDPNTDIPDNVDYPDALVGDNGKISDKDFQEYLENEYGIKVEENGDEVIVTENGVQYDSSNEPQLTPQALALLSEEDQRRLSRGISEEEGEESKVTQQTQMARPQTVSEKSNRQDEIYRAYLAKQKNSKPRKPTATAAGKVVLYNGEPIGHKYDNLFDMIHRAYEKATDEGLFYPPNTRLNPDGTPRN